MKKRMFAALLAALLTMTLAACNGSPAAQTGGGEEFQKNMHQAQGFGLWLTTFCETEDGFYFEYGPLYYLEKATMTATVVCAKPDCQHNDNTCNAAINADTLWPSEDKLFYTTDDYAIVNGVREDYGRRVFSVNQDCTGRNKVQELDFEVDGDNSVYTTAPICHRGSVYFVYSDVLYRVPLGEDIQKAEAIWGEEAKPQETPEGLENFGGFTGHVITMTGKEPSYTLWADGDFVYFMVNTEQEDGAQRDTLFSYNVNTKEVKQVWVTPTTDVVGPWEFGKEASNVTSFTLSSSEDVDQWYVLDGYIYFFLSQNGMWRCSLETGEYEKLADTTAQATYGTAIFSDDYMCLLNDGPALDYFTKELAVGSPQRAGGDTIFVYDLTGKLLKSLPLTGLLEDREALGYFLLFQSGSQLYFLADAGIVTDNGPITQGNFTVSGEQKEEHNLLCCLDLETGEITQIMEFDH